MSRYLTVQEAKDHLIVESDEHDDYIQSLIDAAEDQLRGLLNRASLEEVEVYGELPASLKHALKIQVSNLYENREGNRAGKVSLVPFTFASLITPYRNET